MKNNAKKSTVKMILIAIGGGMIGFFMSFGSRWISDKIGQPLSLPALADGFQWVMVAVLIIQILLSISQCYIRHKIQNAPTPDDENNLFMHYDKSLSWLQGVGTSLTVLFIPLYYSFALYGGMHNVWLIACFILIVAINSFSEVAFIRLNGRINPKMDVDFSSFRLGQKLYDQMDECEKAKMGKVGARLVACLHLIFACTLLVAILLTGILDFSGYECVFIGALWGFFSLFVNWQMRKFS